MRGVIIANGEINNISFLKENICDDDLIICADGGLRYARLACLNPGIIVGDMDSCGELYSDYPEAEIIKYPAAKDLTDLELAIELAVSRGVEEIVIFGALGGRVDHCMANILNLCRVKANNPCILDENAQLYIVGSDISIDSPPGTIISLLPVGDIAKGVKTEGLLYPLNGEDLHLGNSRGMSNVICEEARVSLKSGHLLVIINK